MRLELQLHTVISLHTKIKIVRTIVMSETIELCNDKIPSMFSIVFLSNIAVILGMQQIYNPRQLDANIFKDKGTILYSLSLLSLLFDFK